MRKAKRSPVSGAATSGGRRVDRRHEDEWVDPDYDPTEVARDGCVPEVCCSMRQEISGLGWLRSPGSLRKEWFR